MIVIMLLMLIIVWVLSCLFFAVIGFYIGREKSFGKKRKKKETKESENEYEKYLIDKKKREEENFLNYDGTPQDST